MAEFNFSNVTIGQFSPNGNNIISQGVAMRKHVVDFMSPGTFVDEESTRDVSGWDVAEAVRIAAGISERHNSKPYGFRFRTLLSADPVSDGEGGKLDVMPKTVATSGIHFLGGVILTLDELRHRADPADSILVSNMECNGWPVVIENSNSWRTVRPFGELDVIVDGDGVVVRRGDEPALVEYRARKIEERKQENERRYAAR